MLRSCSRWGAPRQQLVGLPKALTGPSLWRPVGAFSLCFRKGCLCFLQRLPVVLLAQWVDSHVIWGVATATAAGWGLRTPLPCAGPGRSGCGRDRSADFRPDGGRLLAVAALALCF